MTAARRVADLTEDELRELVAAAVEEGVRRGRGRKVSPAPASSPPKVTPERLESARRRLKRRGLLSPPGR